MSKDKWKNFKIYVITIVIKIFKKLTKFNYIRDCSIIYDKLAYNKIIYNK